MFSPLSLPNLLLWTRSDANVTQSGGMVSAWGDLSGNGRNWAQVAPASQPAYTAGAVNGFPALTFDGTRNMTSSLTEAFVKPMTVFMVARYTALVANQYFIDGGVLNTLVFQNFAGNFRTYAGSLIDAGAQTLNTWHVMYGVFNGASSVASLNGTEVAGDAGSAGNTGFNLGSSAGGGNKMTGDIAEVLVYGDAKNASDRATIRRYLGSRYGITVA